MGVLAVAMILVNAGSSAISAVSCCVPGMWRVHSRTLEESGSPEATPSGKNSRCSVHWMVVVLGLALRQAAVAPMAIALWMKERREILAICCLLQEPASGSNTLKEYRELWN